MIKILIFSLSLTKILCFPYTLPGDKNWPSSGQFLELRKSVSGRVSFRGDADYNPHTWNNITNTPKPAAIVQPKTTQDVIEAMKFAKKYIIRISVQSTGHHQDHRNIYDNSIHIDMSTMNSKSIDLTKLTLTVGPGNNFSQIQKYVANQTNKKYVVLCGADPGVGIYGWTVGGGHGFLTRQFGLGVDALISIDLILSNLTLITASKDQNADLFRALRGSGGGAYGIAVSMTVRLYDDPGKISIFYGLYKLSNRTASMFANWLINAPNQAAGYFLPQNFESVYVLIFGICYNTSTTCSSILSKLKDGCIVSDEFIITCEPEVDKFNSFYDFFSQRIPDESVVSYLASTVLNSANIISGLQDITTYIKNNLFTGCSGNGVLGGDNKTFDSEISVSSELRQSLMIITCFSALDVNLKLEEKKYQVNVMTQLSENIYKKYSSWVYWNEPMHDFPKDDWKERYWGGLANYDKLLAVKNKYDPENILSCYHCVGYSRIDNEDPSVCPAQYCTCSNKPNGLCNKSNALNSDFTIIFSIFIIFVIFNKIFLI